MILELWWKSNASDLLTFIDDNLVHLVTHVCWWTHPLFLVAERLLVFCAIPLFLGGSLNWAGFPLLSTSSPLLSTFFSGPLNWALFWAKLLNWALFWANPLVWALFWALKKAYLLLRARFWVVLLFWALKKALKRVKPLKIALKKALKLCHNLPLFFRVSVPYTNHSASHIPDYVTPTVHSHRRRHSVTSVSHSGETLAQRKCHTLHSNWPSVTLCTEVVCQALASSDCRQPISHLSCSLAGRKSDTKILITYTGTLLAGIVQRTMGRTSIHIPRYHQK